MTDNVDIDWIVEYTLETEGTILGQSYTYRTKTSTIKSKEVDDGKVTKDELTRALEALSMICEDIKDSIHKMELEEGGILQTQVRKASNWIGRTKEVDG